MPREHHLDFDIIRNWGILDYKNYTTRPAMQEFLNRHNVHVDGKAMDPYITECIKLRNRHDYNLPGSPTAVTALGTNAPPGTGASTDVQGNPSTLPPLGADIGAEQTPTSRLDSGEGRENTEISNAEAFLNQDQSRDPALDTLSGVTDEVGSGFAQLDIGSDNINTGVYPAVTEDGNATANAEPGLPVPSGPERFSLADGPTYPKDDPHAYLDWGNWGKRDETELTHILRKEDEWENSEEGRRLRRLEAERREAESSEPQNELESNDQDTQDNSNVDTLGVLDTEPETSAKRVEDA